ncbi:hypothetical protein T439DRAFT_321405 [Meredithblackwellia eburnea MCA 4105]
MPQVNERHSYSNSRLSIPMQQGQQGQHQSASLQNLADLKPLSSSEHVHNRSRNVNNTGWLAAPHQTNSHFSQGSQQQYQKSTFELGSRRRSRSRARSNSQSRGPVGRQRRAEALGLESGYGYRY